MNEAKIEHAKMWAGMHHKGQVRKYTGEPYIEHPIAVYELCREHGLSETACVAAILHDVVEDTNASMEEVEELFGEEVAEYVWYLTKPPAYVGNRQTRKALDRLRLANAPEEVRKVKFFDVFHNAPSIREHEPDFWKTWRVEMWHLFESMNVETLITNDLVEETLI